MMFEWVRFFVTAALLIFALSAFALEVLGVYRFGFVMNRIHAAGIGDTLGLLCVAAAMMVSRGLSMDMLKMVLIVSFMWFTSPASTHFLSQVEYYTNPRLYDHVARWLPEEKRDGNRTNTEAAAGAVAETAAGRVAKAASEACAGKDLQMTVEAQANMSAGEEGAKV